MKAILTFVFFLTVTLTASANTNEVKVINVEEITFTTTKEEVKATKIARLYKFKNSRVKKALKFTTKANKAKMA